MRRTAAIVLIFCVVTAGCIGPSTDDQEEVPSRTLSVEEVDSTPTSEKVIGYSQLSSEQQEVFVSAVESEDDNTGIPEEITYEVWIDHEYVEYDDRLYRVVVSAA